MLRVVTDDEGRGEVRAALDEIVLEAPLGPLQVASIQLHLDERGDVDAVDEHALHLTADVDVAEVGAADPDAAEVNLVEPGADKIDVLESCAGEIDPLESSTGETALAELLGHGRQREPNADVPSRPSRLLSAIRPPAIAPSPQQIARPAQPAVEDVVVSSIATIQVRHATSGGDRAAPR
jgi:hypothetical protein